MKLPGIPFIAREKVTQYLLVPHDRGDKSRFLNAGGFAAENPDLLLAALGRIQTHGEARLVDENQFGRYYEIVGMLDGPNGVRLRVRTIWMAEHLSGLTKFITLIPLEIVRP